MLNGHKRRAIGELCEFTNGNGFRPPDWKPTGLPIIRIQNLNGSKCFNYFDGVPKPKWIVEPGDLLFAWAGVKGVSFGPTIWSGPRGVLNQHIFRVTPHKGIDKYWLYAALQAITQRIEANAHGFKSSLVHVHKDDIVRQLVDVPALNEQKKIADVLRTWDDAIEACERMIVTLTARQRALAHQLVFGDRRLGNHARNAEKQKVRWLTVPADWSVVPIGSVADERTDINRSGIALEVLSCSKYHGFVRSLQYFKKQVFSSDLSGYKIIRRGDFGFPSNHVEEGSIGLQNLVDEGLVSPIYTVFRFNDERVDSGFAYSLLKTELYRHIFQVSTSASVDRRGSLRWSDFSTLPFPLPPIAEQREIQKVLDAGGSQIAQQQRERDALIKQKSGLMQKLLTGQWRVRVNA